MLTRRESFEKPSFSLSQRVHVTHAYYGSEPVFSPKDNAAKVRPMCAYCKKRGHLINNCFLLKKIKIKKNIPNAVAMIKTPLVSLSPEAECVDLDIYSPFIMKGTVSLSDGSVKVPVTILRDTAASRSIILQHASFR